MNPQLIQTIRTRILATSLFVASACGTFALFGSVPVIARLTAPSPQVAHRHHQATPLAPASSASETSPSKTKSGTQSSAELGTEMIPAHTGQPDRYSPL